MICQLLLTGSCQTLDAIVPGEVEGVEPVRDELRRRRAKMIPGMSASDTTTASRVIEKRNLARDDRFVR
jgi:hypothetical protein